MDSKPYIKLVKDVSYCLHSLQSSTRSVHSSRKTQAYTYQCDNLSSRGEPERAAHWLTSLSLHITGIVTHKQISISQQPGQLLSVRLHMHEQSFTLKSRAEFVTFISAVYAFPLPEATSTTIVIEICTACGQPTVNDLHRQIRNKLSCVLQLQSS